MFQSRLRKIAAELLVVTDSVAEAGAKLVAGRARERVPVGPGDVHLRDHIHVVRGDSPGEWFVQAGDGEAFYGHILEHGSVNAPPHPFLIPAAQDVRTSLQAMAQEAGRRLE